MQCICLLLHNIFKINYDEKYTFSYEQINKTLYEYQVQHCHSYNIFLATLSNLQMLLLLNYYYVLLCNIISKLLYQKIISKICGCKWK